jgi:hypothetical protein
MNRRKALEDRTHQLMLAAADRVREYDRGPTGVIEYINACARSSTVSVSTLTPRAPQGGSATGLGYRLTAVETEYHNVGKLINALETGAFPVETTLLEITPSAKGHGHLALTLDINISLIPEGVRE